MKGECTVQTNIPLTREIDQEPGLLLHLKGYGGIIQNLNRRRTRYVDRFFLSSSMTFTSLVDSSHVYGMDIRDFGPKSSSEGWTCRSIWIVEGGRKEGDVLGGDCCASASVALSLPVILSHEYFYGIRARIFYELGNVWNHNTEFHSLWNTTRSVFGVGLNIPLSILSLDFGYLINQKRFTFSLFTS